MKGGKSGAMHVASQSCRARRAIAIVALLLSVIWASRLMDGSSWASQRGVGCGIVGARCLLASESVSTMQDLGDSAEAMVFDLFEANSGAVVPDRGELPPGFAEEVIDPDALGCSSFVSAPGTVGLICAGNLDDVREQIDGLLSNGGWKSIDQSAGEFYCTYVKEDGDYRWAYLTYSVVAGSVTVSITSLADSSS